MTSPLSPQDPSPRDPSSTDPSTGRTSARPAADAAADRPDATPPRGLDRNGKVKRTRASGLWVGLITAAVLAIAFLVFIAQNSEKVSIKFLGFEGQLSLAIALLLSAVIGALVVAVPGIVRIAQLRTALRKNAKH
jgi:putative membrane protein